jgi:hypothetical protein
VIAGKGAVERFVVAAGEPEPAQDRREPRGELRISRKHKFYRPPVDFVPRRSSYCATIW